MKTYTFFLLFSKIGRLFTLGCIAASSTPSTGPLPRLKICFFLLSACAEELLWTQNTFLQNLSPPDNEKRPHASNPIPYLELEYLSG